MKYANGGMVFEGGGGSLLPTIQMFTQIEQAVGGASDLKIYGHAVTRGHKHVRIQPGEPTVSWVPKRQEPEDGSSFSSQCVGQWQLSHEVAGDKHMECTGLLRPAFELSLAEARTLAPSPLPQANAMCLFAVKKFGVKAGALVAL